jgi:DHA2 family multidrug resistance protein
MIIGVMLAVILEILDTSIVNVALPTMMGNLGATVDEISWVATSYIVANVIVIPMTSFFAASFGRRRYFVGSIILFTVASFLCGAARTLPELVAFRDCYLMIFVVFLLLAPLVPLLRRPGSPGSPSAAR